jgi:hypothetical protein
MDKLEYDTYPLMHHGSLHAALLVASEDSAQEEDDQWDDGIDRVSWHQGPLLVKGLGRVECGGSFLRDFSIAVPFDHDTALSGSQYDFLQTCLRGKRENHQSAADKQD